MKEDPQRLHNNLDAAAQAEDRPCSLIMILDFYLNLPDTPHRSSRSDRQLASQLVTRRIPWTTIRSALLLASARRLARDPQAPPLPPIRSLHYFLPVIEELRDKPISLSYLDYLQSKILTLSPTPTGAPHKTRTS
jgi:hypothetical protein